MRQADCILVVGLGADDPHVGPAELAVSWAYLDC